MLINHDGAALSLAAAAGLFFTQYVVIRGMGANYAEWPKSRVSRQEVVEAARAGIAKLPSNLSLIFSLRGIVLWPKLLFGRLATDTIGFAVSLGEVLWKIGMILVNRSYARFCVSTDLVSGIISETVTRGLLLISAFLLAGFCVGVLAPGVVPWLGVLDWVKVGTLITMYGPVCAMFLIRYCLWSIGLRSAGLTYILLGWVAQQVLAVSALPKDYQAMGIVIGAFIALVISVIYAHRQLIGIKH
jgi:hypothetical protein